MNTDEKQDTQLAHIRTQLAAERTFSAWIRTALAALAGGLAILRLVVFKSELHQVIAHIIGELLIIWGSLLILLAAVDYKRMSDQLKVKHYKSSAFGFLIIVGPLLMISLLLFWVTLP